MSARRRLPPAERRRHLLDVAQSIVETDGVAACTVDRISTVAQVTPQLVHRYFGTRPSLLRALYEREDDRYHAVVRQRLEGTGSFEEVVRVFVTANVDLLSNATAIGRLRDLPELTATRARRERSSSRDAERVLVRALTAEYPTDPATTAFVLRLGSAASIEAGSIAAEHEGVDRDAHIDRTVRFILAGIEAIAGPRQPAQNEDASPLG